MCVKMRKELLSMLDQQLKWFETLAAESRNAANAVAKRNWQIWDFIAKHYSEKAHFLYELIQNADDAEAETIRFELYEDRLVFRHNGKKRFTISNPKTELEDKNNDRLGSINSIVNVGNSTKTSNDIGKFGIGFKSVFIYTKRPEIYDDTFKFAIDDYVVPCLLHEDYSGREKGETVFVFPFRTDGLQGAVNDPVQEISKKMKELVHPTFFLKSVKRIEWHYNNESGSYVKEQPKLLYECNDGTKRTFVERTRLRNTVNTNDNCEEFLVFRRPTALNEKLECVIAFALDTNGNIVKTDRYAPFCYFPTQSQLGLNFIIQAPFCLTSTRESFDFSNEDSENRNNRLYDELSTLFADSLVYMRDMYENSGKDQSKLFLTESIFKILPLKGFVNKVSFLNGFYEKTLAKLQTERIIPASFERGCYCEKADVRIPGFDHIKVFNDDDLNEFVRIKTPAREQQVHWAFAQTWDYGAGHVQSDINTYIKQLYGVLIDRYLVKSNMILTSISEGKLLERHWQDKKWLEKFYEWFANKVKVADAPRYRTYKLFVDQNDEACTVGESVNGRFIKTLYLPSEDIPEGMKIHQINSVIHKFDSVQQLERTYEIGQFDRSALIDQMIAQANNANDECREKTTRKLIELLVHVRTTQGDINKIVSWVRFHGIFRVKSGDSREISCGLLRHSDFWSGIDSVCSSLFVDEEYYSDVGINEGTWERIGIYSHPCVAASAIIFQLLKELLDHFNESSVAVFVWKILNELVKLDGVRWPDDVFSQLMNKEWISLSNGVRKSPNDITIDDFREIRTTINNELDSGRIAKLFGIEIEGSADFQWALLGGLPRHLGVIGCMNRVLRDACGKSEQLYRKMKDTNEGQQFNVEEYRTVIWKSGEIIKENENVRDDMLAALRRRIKQFGYGPEKLLFELFQNADDAYEQNKAFNLGQEREGCEFLVKWDGTECSLIVVHWGRPINKQHENIPGSERDLENMLQMHQSDKQVENEAGVTGKFGLGFKTVFLVSDVPYILSGDLRLKILGGYLPCEFDVGNPWVGDLEETYTQSTQLPPTIVVIPIRNDARQAMYDALELFKERAPYLVNCSRCVKKITIIVE